jgi:hypothetical protein
VFLERFARCAHRRRGQGIDPAARVGGSVIAMQRRTVCSADRHRRGWCPRVATLLLEPPDGSASAGSTTRAAPRSPARWSSSTAASTRGPPDGDGMIRFVGLTTNRVARASVGEVRTEFGATRPAARSSASPRCVGHQPAMTVRTAHACGELWPVRRCGECASTCNGPQVPDSGTRELAQRRSCGIYPRDVELALASRGMWARAPEEGIEWVRARGHWSDAARQDVPRRIGHADRPVRPDGAAAHGDGSAAAADLWAFVESAAHLRASSCPLGRRGAA